MGKFNLDCSWEEYFSLDPWEDCAHLRVDILRMRGGAPYEYILMLNAWVIVNQDPGEIAHHHCSCRMLHVTL